MHTHGNAPSPAAQLVGEIGRLPIGPRPTPPLEDAGVDVADPYVMAATTTEAGIQPASQPLSKAAVPVRTLSTIESTVIALVNTAVKA